MKKFFVLTLCLMLFALCSSAFAADMSSAVGAGIKAEASLQANTVSVQKVGLEICRDVWCYKADGNLRWYDHSCNKTPTEGLNEFLDSMWKNGASANWYVGLIVGPGSSTTYADGDTAAQINGTNGWDEDSTAYSEATRPALTMGTVSGGSVNNSASKAVFTIDSTCVAGCVIAGNFIISNNTKAGTTGILAGEGDWSVDRTVYGDDTLNCQITSTITSSD
jgi:hypothetical protein